MRKSEVYRRVRLRQGCMFAGRPTAMMSPAEMHTAAIAPDILLSKHRSIASQDSLLHWLRNRQRATATFAVFARSRIHPDLDQHAPPARQ